MDGPNIVNTSVKSFNKTRHTVRLHWTGSVVNVFEWLSQRPNFNLTKKSFVPAYPSLLESEHRGRHDTANLQQMRLRARFKGSAGTALDLEPLTF